MYDLNEAEQKALAFRRSIYKAADIEEGTSFSKENIRITRPEQVMPLSMYQQLLDKKAAKT